MNQLHPTLTDDLRDAAMMFSLGLMEPAEADRFESHLAECETCRAEVQAETELIGGVGLSVPQVAPPRGLRERVLANLPPRPYLVVRGSDAPWEPFGPPGIEVKHLMEDPSTGTRSFLLRLAPGSVLPAHHHRHSEHCYVLEGEMYDAEHTLKPGDYELRLPGSAHAASQTRTGAVVLIVAGHHDERP